jgi:CelD/BcsL family acetyltransferase involved in cellulose biosynthesis
MRETTVINLRSHDGLPSGTVLDEWDSLVDDDPHGTFFHRPAYLGVWLAQLGTRVTPRVHLAYRDGRLVGVIPVGREMEGSPTGPIEVVRFLGGSDVTDYLGPVARPEDRDDVAAAYLAKLAGDGDFDEFVAGGLMAESGWADAFVRHAEANGLEVLERAEEDVCPRIDLSDGYDAYLGRLSGKLRHEQRRKARKLQRDAGDIRLVEVPADDAAKALDAFFAMVSEGTDDKSRFFLSEEMRAFFGALADRFAPAGVFRIHQLEVGGVPGAATVSLVDGREWGLYNSAFDETLRMLAPGMVLVAELIRAAAEAGCDTFDLLRGDEPYKYRFGAADRAIERVTIARR